MKTVEVSQSALESLQKMVEQLQGERDELLEVAMSYLGSYAIQPGRIGYERDARLRSIIAKCTAKPEMWA